MNFILSLLTAFISYGIVRGGFDGTTGEAGMTAVLAFLFTYFFANVAAPVKRNESEEGAE